jgi:predicted  nucleic acid-binding Zn-ribbon protein
LLDLALLTDLTTKLSELNTELQAENKTIIKMTGAIDSFNGKLKVIENSMMKNVLTDFS